MIFCAVLFCALKHCSAFCPPKKDDYSEILFLFSLCAGLHPSTSWKFEWWFFRDFVSLFSVRRFASVDVIKVPPPTIVQRFCILLCIGSHPLGQRLQSEEDLARMKHAGWRWCIFFDRIIHDIFLWVGYFKYSSRESEPLQWAQAKKIYKGKSNFPVQEELVNAWIRCSMLWIFAFVWCDFIVDDVELRTTHA